jgi:transcriptional regulator of aromatic amino acid metabolism
MDSPAFLAAYSSGPAVVRKKAEVNNVIDFFIEILLKINICQLKRRNRDVRGLFKLFIAVLSQQILMGHCSITGSFHQKRNEMRRVIPYGI